MKQRSLIILISCVLGFSCEKAESLLPPQKFKAKDFPFTLGSYWEYYVIDSFDHKTDTLRATVIAKDISVSGVNDLWMLKWQGKNLPITDTQYVTFTDTLIAFYDYSRFSDSLYLESEYSFPFQEDDEWILSQNQGTYSVHSDRTESSHFGKDYGKGFYIQRRAKGGGNFSIHDNMMLVKDIGIVYRQINVTRGIPFRINAYFLLDYHIE